MGHWSRWALLLTCVAGLGYAYHVYSGSPEAVPLHYGPTGLPDRWGHRSELLKVHVGLIGIGSAIFLALPALLTRMPPSLVNLPHKDYWLAPERRRETTAKFAVWSSTFGTALNLLVVAMQAVLGPNGSSSPLPLVVVLSFVLFSIGSCVWLVRSFRLPALTRHR